MTFSTNRGRRSNKEYLENQYSHKTPLEPTAYPNTSWQHLVGHMVDYFVYLAMLELLYLDHCIIVVDSIDLMEGCKEEWYFLKSSRSRIPSGSTNSFFYQSLTPVSVPLRCSSLAGTLSYLFV